MVSDRRSPSAMCEFPFEWWGCVSRLRAEVLLLTVTSSVEDLITTCVYDLVDDVVDASAKALACQTLTTKLVDSVSATIVMCSKPARNSRGYRRITHA